MSEAMNYKLPPLPDLLEKAIRNLASACRHSDDWKVRAAAAESLRGEIRAYAIAAIETQGAPDVRNLLARFEHQCHRMGVLWERCQGKGWPKAESDEFTRLRDELVPETRAQLLASAPPAPQADKLVNCSYGDSGYACCEGGPCAADVHNNSVLASVVQQEPLGFISPKQVERIVDPDGEFGAYIPMRKTPAGNFTLAVYTHPAQQAKPQPLSDEQIELLMRSIGTTYADDNDERMRNHAEWQRMNHRQIVRAIEAAHGITKE